MKLLRSMALAFAMYSKIPMPQMEWSEDNLAYALCFFPAVGVVVGAVLLLWLKLAAFLAIGAVLRGAVALLIPFLLTGGIHLDGFCDTSDALGSHQTKERKLEILKDSHIGAFALIACTLYLILFFGAWCEVETGGRTLYVLALIPVLSRGFSGFFMVTLKNARGTGLLATFTDAAAVGPVRCVLVLWSAAAAAAVLAAEPNLIGILTVLAAVGVSIYYVCMSKRQFGGITGDLAGFFLQLCELGCLLAVVLGQRLSALI